MVFLATKDRMVFATGLEGGGGMAFRAGLPPATLVYMTHSAWRDGLPTSSSLLW